MHPLAVVIPRIAVVIPSGQGWKQVGELALAFGLSSLIGIEREWRAKAAGLRTHTLVGVGAALFLLVSKYGFSDVVGNGVTLDPSRVAAQIVSGIGFIGGGLIFVRGDAVRGLTTAAAVWVTAAVGMASGAGLAILALATTGGYFIVALVFRSVETRLPRSRYQTFRLRVLYEDGRGILRHVLSESTRLGYSIGNLDTQPVQREVRGVPAVAVTIDVRGQPSPDPLAVALDDLDGVLEVAMTEQGGD